MRDPKTEIQQTLPPPRWLLRSWGDARSSHLPLPKMNKETGLAPNSWGTQERNEVREPRGWHLPIHRTLNSLTWYLIFDVQTACSLCCKLLYSLTSSLPPWSSFFRVTEKKSYDPPRQHIKKQRHYFANKGPPSQSYGFSNSHVWMWELNHKENWVLKNWCFSTVLLEKTLESPLDCKKIQPVHSKGNQSWIFIGRTDAEAETPPDLKSWLIRKDPDAGKYWRQEEKGTTEDEMVGWHHWLNGHEFEYTPGDGDGQGGLAYCSPGGRQESDTTERLKWTDWTKTISPRLGVLNIPTK